MIPEFDPSLRTTFKARLRLGVSVVLGRYGCARRFKVFEDDLAVCSFPESGTHWACFILGNLLHPGEPMNFGNMEARVATFTAS